MSPWRPWLAIAFLATLVTVVIFAVVDRDVPNELWGLALASLTGLAGATTPTSRGGA